MVVCATVVVLCLAFLIQSAEAKWHFLQGRPVWLVTLIVSIALAGVAKGLDVIRSKRNAPLVINGYAENYALHVEEAGAPPTKLD